MHIPEGNKLTLRVFIMATFINNIILEILEFIYLEGGNPKTWYIGVTNDLDNSCLTKIRCIIRTMP